MQTLKGDTNSASRENKWDIKCIQILSAPRKSATENIGCFHY